MIIEVIIRRTATQKKLMAATMAKIRADPDAWEQHGYVERWLLDDGTERMTWDFYAHACRIEHGEMTYPGLREPLPRRAYRGLWDSTDHGVLPDGTIIWFRDEGPFLLGLTSDENARFSTSCATLDEFERLVDLYLRDEEIPRHEDEDEDEEIDEP